MPVFDWVCHSEKFSLEKVYKKSGNLYAKLRTNAVNVNGTPNLRTVRQILKSTEPAGF